MHRGFACALVAIGMTAACDQPRAETEQGSDVVIEAVFMAGDGITLNSSAGGRHLEFGTPREDFVPQAEAAFGAIVSEVPCADGGGSVASYADGPEIVFLDGAFAGWSAVQTTDDFLSMRRNWFTQEPNFTVGEADENGVPFSYGPEGETIHGYFADATPRALLKSHRAGETCATSVLGD